MEAQFADPLLRKFNLVVFDFRSHGDTEADDLPEGYGITEAAEDALAFMVRDTNIRTQTQLTLPSRMLSIFRLVIL